MHTESVTFMGLGISVFLERAKTFLMIVRKWIEAQILCIYMMTYNFIDSLGLIFPRKTNRQNKDFHGIQILDVNRNNVHYGGS